MTRREIIHTIAGYELAIGAEIKIPAMRGFADYYLKSLDRPALLVLQEYNKAVKEIAGDAAKRFEAEIRAKSDGVPPPTH
ncbi:MAG TPA: hypothetical protein VL357_05975 [Rariglobus sp.]|jgi:hypothetical protein|nr:hypothetical protein [Rariglobus sp.]